MFLQQPQAMGVGGTSIQSKVTATFTAHVIRSHTNNRKHLTIIMTTTASVPFSVKNGGEVYFQINKNA